MAAAAAWKLLILLLCPLSLIAHAGQGPGHRILPTATGSVSPDVVCSEFKVLPSSGGAIVPLHHRHGPCSPLPSKAMPSMEEVLRRDELRARYIQRMFSGSTNGDNVQQSAEVSVPTVLGSAYLDTLQYVITVGLGSPAATQNVLIDTGSDISWVQCAPCSECHSQADQLFDPSSSSTYSPFSCDSQACTQLGQEGNGCSSSQCQYIVRYVDGSYTAGTYGSDTLTLGSDAITSFQFGCSSDESGVDTDTLTDGLMGLGRGPQSLVSQTAGTFG